MTDRLCPSFFVGILVLGLDVESDWLASFARTNDGTPSDGLRQRPYGGGGVCGI